MRHSEDLLDERLKHRLSVVYRQDGAKFSPKFLDSPSKFASQVVEITISQNSPPQKKKDTTTTELS